MSPPSDLGSQTVTLSIPADTRFVAAVRLVAASLGAEHGLSVDDLEDLRLGVDELVSVLIDGAPEGTRIDVELGPAESGITVRGAIRGGGGDAAADPLTNRILDAVVDHHELDPSSFVLTKASSLREHI